MWARRSATIIIPPHCGRARARAIRGRPLRDAGDPVDERVDDAARSPHRPPAPSSSGPIRTTSRSSRTSASSWSASAVAPTARRVAAARASSSIRSTGRSSREPRPPSTSAIDAGSAEAGGNGEEDRVRHEPVVSRSDRAHRCEPRGWRALGLRLLSIMSESLLTLSTEQGRASPSSTSPATSTCRRSAPSTPSSSSRSRRSTS